MNKKVEITKCSECQVEIQRIDEAIKEFKERYGNRERMPTWYQGQTERLEKRKLLLTEMKHKSKEHYERTTPK